MEKDIDKALAGIENAAKRALKVLSDFVGHDVTNADDRGYALSHVGLIVRDLQTAKAEAAANAKYEGLSEEEIAEQKAAEREEELANLQAQTRAKLEARYASLAVVPVTDAETDGDEDAGGDVPPTGLFVNGAGGEPESDAE